jgi:hypothetical protein
LCVVGFRPLDWNLDPTNWTRPFDRLVNRRPFAEFVVYFESDFLTNSHKQSEFVVQYSESAFTFRPKRHVRSGGGQRFCESQRGAHETYTLAAATL